MSLTIESKASSGQQVVQRIAELASGFRERIEITDQHRSVPQESIDELVDAGMARLMVPRERGGLDRTVRDLVDATAAAAAGCGSTGWLSGLMGHVSHVVGRFPLEAQEAVWGDGPDIVMASSFMGAKATEVPGGYRISGTSPFSSGVNNARWVYLGGMVANAGQTPKMRLFLVPKSDYLVKDTWHTVGMRGTGSNTVITDDVFVPEQFTISHVDAREGTTPGSLVNSNPNFRLPWVATGAVVFVAAMLGAAQGAHDSVVASLIKKRTPSGARVGANEVLQIEVAFAAARIDTARQILYKLADRADLHPDYTMLERASVTRDYTFAAMLLVEAIDTLVQISGTAAFGRTSTVTRAWRDIHFAAAHQGLNKRATGGRYGRVVLDIEETTPPLFY